MLPGPHAVAAPLIALEPVTQPTQTPLWHFSLPVELNRSPPKLPLWH